jgi:hypothetical protein
MAEPFIFMMFGFHLYGAVVMGYHGFWLGVVLLTPGLLLFGTAAYFMFIYRD